MTSRGYTHFYLYAYNEHDYGGPSFNFFGDPLRFRALLQELINDGLAPVVWLVPDDAPRIHGMSADAVNGMLSQFVPFVEELTSSFVVGLELDEYWSPSMVDAIGSHVARLTSKPVAVHQLPGNWNLCTFSWCDYMILQYGFGNSESHIDSMTRAAIAALGKPVVAGEYETDNESISVTLGNRGVSAGAAGFGNGGAGPRR